MPRRSLLYARLFSVPLALVLIMVSFLAGPAPQARAESTTKLFQAEFEGQPAGPLTAPLTVNVGTVVPEEGNVTLGQAASQALVLDGTAGQATALFQWANYPGALPISTTERLEVVISSEFYAEAGTEASYGLLAGTEFFEFFRFEPDGTITRDGQTLDLTYNPDEKFHLDVKIFLEDGSAQALIMLKQTGDRTAVKVSLGSAFSPATLNQLRFQALDGSAAVSVDKVLVRLRRGGGDDDPPAEIEIDDDEIEFEIEEENGVTFISINITIVNTGGKARGSFLVLDLDDFDDLELADVIFIDGIGFVSDLDDDEVTIGLGQNNIIGSNGKIKVKIKFKADDGDNEIEIDAKFKLRFSDTSGEQEIEFDADPVVIPVAVVTPVVVVERLPLTVIDVRFEDYWEEEGGLAIFGLPLTQPITRTDGVVVQYFERARLEWHPTLVGTDYEVLIGLLGVELGYATPPTEPPTSTVELQWYYPATGHLIAPPFRSFWQNQGGLAIFGLPISGVVIENGRQVQYFERARLELHPELAGTPYEVQIGHLGVLVLQADLDDDGPDDD